MQYKIPVQVENEDKIFLNLSLRQLAILMVWLWIAYYLFKNLEKNLWWTVAVFPSWVIAFITIWIALFRNSEMTFLPFMLNLIRLKLNVWTRVWSKWTTSYSKMEIWYVTQDNSTQEKIQTWTKEIHNDILSKI